MVYKGVNGERILVATSTCGNVYISVTAEKSRALISPDVAKEIADELVLAADVMIEQYGGGCEHDLETE